MDHQKLKTDLLGKLHMTKLTQLKRDIKKEDFLTSALLRQSLHRTKTVAGTRTILLHHWTDTMDRDRYNYTSNYVYSIIMYTVY